MDRGAPAPTNGRVRPAVDRPHSDRAGTRVLVVDGDRAILRTMDVNLRARGYDVLLAGEGRIALALAARRHSDVVVLDLGLPDIDGIDVMAGPWGWTWVPIIVLSARTAEEAKVAALDAGADDYMTKPFGIAEFMARRRASLRVTRPPDEPPVLRPPDFSLGLAVKRARRGADDVHLTATEWQILGLSARNPGRLIAHAQLLEQVWGLTDTKNNYVRVYLSSIRHKLEPEPAHPRYFLTEPRSGVRFDPGEPSARQGIAPPTTLEADRLVPRWLGPQRA
jgi:two-component system, OmpR family, KDP operon response regulator KdpE